VRREGSKEGLATGAYVTCQMAEVAASRQMLFADILSLISRPRHRAAAWIALWRRALSSARGGASRMLAQCTTLARNANTPVSRRPAGVHSEKRVKILTKKINHTDMWLHAFPWANRHHKWAFLAFVTRTSIITVIVRIQHLDAFRTAVGVPCATCS
jgi:hypothetical protein